jgi:hypothetical protein
MGQQPSIEITEPDEPRPVPQPPPSGRWRPVKPGLITTPEQLPTGGRFGHIGPDTGWAYRIIDANELPEDDKAVRDVIAALMGARASVWGRGPTKEDFEAALAMCGYGYDARPEIVQRRARWTRAAGHEVRPGETAVAEVGPASFEQTPAQIRRELSAS